MLRVKKPNGDLRISLDPTNLNKYIVRPACNSHTLEEVSFELKDTKFFFLFDATNVFFSSSSEWEIQNFDSDAFTTRSVYVNALTMALSNSNDLLESALGELLPGLKGVVNITYDILIFGSTQQEHESNVITFLERCLEVDLKLNLR